MSKPKSKATKAKAKTAPKASKAKPKAKAKAKPPRPALDPVATAALAARLRAMTDEELLTWSRTPQPFDPAVKPACVLLAEYRRREREPAKPGSTSDPTVGVPGIWTPWAQILCLTCHGPTIERGFGEPPRPVRDYNLRDIARAPSDEPDDREALAVCNKCRRSVVIGRPDVAAMQAVGFALSELAWEGAFGWSLAQTGGMCAALNVHTDRGGKMTNEIVVYDSENDDEIRCLSAAVLDMTKPEEDRAEFVLESSDDVPYSEPERLARWILGKLGIEPKESAS